MFTQLDCQFNSSTNCRISSWTAQTVQMRYYVSWKTIGYYRKDSLKLAAHCPVSGCWPSCFTSAKEGYVFVIVCLSVC